MREQAATDQRRRREDAALHGFAGELARITRCSSCAAVPISGAAGSTSIAASLRDLDAGRATASSRLSNERSSNSSRRLQRLRVARTVLLHGGDACRKQLQFELLAAQGLFLVA